MGQIRRDLPNDEYQAAVGANNASAANVFATIADLSGGGTGDADRIIFDAKYDQVGGIIKGQAVYISGSDGTNITVSKADYSTEATSSKTLGLVVLSGANNFQGQVISDGLLDGLDTSAAGAAGDPVWLGDDGNLIYGLLNKPYAPNHLVFIGIVTKKNPSTGEIFVKVQNGFELDEIHNVDVKSSLPTDGQVLTYDSVTGLWRNETPLVGSDVTLTSAGGSQTLVNDGTGPALATKGVTAGTGISLSSTATDLTVTNTAPDQVVALTSGTGIGVTGTYPNFTISNTDPTTGVTLASSGGANSLVNDGTGPSLAVKGLTAGSGILIGSTATAISITNSNPDQTVVLNSGTGINVTGTYPNFTIDNTGALSDVNIYNTDGTLTAQRIVDLNAQGIYFQDSSVGGSQFVVNIDNGTKLSAFTLQPNVFDLESLNLALGSVITGTPTSLLLKYIGASGIKQMQINNGGLRINGQYYLPNTDGTSGQVMTTDGAGNVTWKPIGGVLGAENYITASSQWSKTLPAPVTLLNGQVANGFTFFDNFLDKVANGTTPYYEFNIDFGISITLSGTSGTANINVNGVNYLATFNTSLYQTAVDWVSLNQATLNALGIVVFALGSGADGRIRFGSSNEALLNAISITNVTTNLSGVLANEFTGLPTAAGDHLRVQYTGEPIDGQRLLHTIRANFNIQVGSVQYAELRLYRYQNDSVIGSGVSIQRNPDESGQQVVIETYTGSSSDAFVTGGFYIAVANNTGTSLEFTGASGILIQSIFQKPTLF